METTNPELKQRALIAEKEHICGKCKKPIHKGEEYIIMCKAFELSGGRIRNKFYPAHVNCVRRKDVAPKKD